MSLLRVKRQSGQVFGICMIFINLSVYSDDEYLDWDSLLGVEHHESWNGRLDWHEVVINLILHILVGLWEPLVTMLVLNWVDQSHVLVRLAWKTWGEILDSIPDLDIVFTRVLVL